MSKITNDGLIQSGAGCFIWQPYGNSVKGFNTSWFHKH